MIVSPQEYNSLIQKLIDPNKFLDYLRIPEDEPIYEIDLNERLIYAPEFLSVEEDHNSEIIWFKTDRFYDNIDLYNAQCWIRYENAAKEKHVYPTTLLVGSSENEHDKILIPWAIGNEVSKKTGIVKFAFHFFELSEDNNRFLYILNTRPAESKILVGLNFNPIEFLKDENSSEEEYIPERKWLADELHRLEEAYSVLSNNYELYWTDV